MSAIAREALHLIRSQRWAALATLEDGEPMASMVAYALAPGDSSLLLLLSQLAPHTRRLIDHPRASLAIAEPDDHEGDPQRLQRVTLSGRAAAIRKADPEFVDAAEQYIERFPDALPRFELGDFVLFRFVPEEVRYVGGLARTARLRWPGLADPGEV